MGPRSKKESEDFDGFLSLDKEISKRKSSDNAFLLLASAGKKNFASECDLDLSESKDQKQRLASAPYLGSLPMGQGLQQLATTGPVPTLSHIKYENNITHSIHE